MKCRTTSFRCKKKFNELKSSDLALTLMHSSFAYASFHFRFLALGNPISDLFHWSLKLTDLDHLLRTFSLLQFLMIISLFLARTFELETCLRHSVIIFNNDGLKSMHYLLLRYVKIGTAICNQRLHQN